MCKSKIKYHKIILLWLQVAFYSVMSTVLLSIFTNFEIGVGNYFKSFTPLLSNQYWYFTAYFGLFLIIPCLNLVIEYISKKQFQVLLLNFGIWFSVLPTLMQIDSFKLLNGYSMVWLTIMYMVGAYIRKYVDISKISKKKVLSIYLLACCGTWANKWVVENLTLKVFGEIRYGDLFVQYVSPTIIIAAIALFAFFLKIDIHNIVANKIIKIAALVSFSVYLIHSHPLVSAYILKDRFIRYLDYSTFGLVARVLLTSILIYLLCIAIDYVRITIFKFLHIEEKCINIVDWVKMKFPLE